MAQEREVIFEFFRVGTSVRVTAIDAESGTEAVMVGDPMAGEATLKRLARQKLDYIMAKNKG
jgi:hypothetical protein